MNAFATKVQRAENKDKPYSVYVANMYVTPRRVAYQTNLADVLCRQGHDIAETVMSAVVDSQPQRLNLVSIRQIRKLELSEYNDYIIHSLPC
jgi:hypothetical protein